MRLKVITVASQKHPYLEALIQSADNCGMDMHVIYTEGWRGFGSKIIETYNYLKTLEGYTHFVFVDAYDTLFQKPITSYDGGILFSTEKHRWPDADANYPECDKIWKYLNSGTYIAPIYQYLNMIDKNPVKNEDDDQRYFTQLYLKGENIKLDMECKLFQSYAFMQPRDFSINRLLRNNITGTEASVIHFNGKSHESNIYKMVKYKTLSEAANQWENTEHGHKTMNEGFASLVNFVPQLKEHRDFVENNIFGFGERSFHWMWKLIIQDMPDDFTFMEIGVLKGQTLSLCRLLADMLGKKCERYGITPLSTEGGVWQSDYGKDIVYIHDQFELEKDYTILKGLSEDPDIISMAQKISTDILYIDGGHEERNVINDIDNYSHLVKSGGYLVIDDCCNNFPMPFGYFCGIESVTKVVNDKLNDNNDWEFVLSVVHNRVYRRK